MLSGQLKIFAFVGLKGCGGVRLQEQLVVLRHLSEAGTRHGEVAVNPSLGARLQHPCCKRHAATSTHSTADSQALPEFCIKGIQPLPIVAAGGPVPVWVGVEPQAQL